MVEISSVGPVGDSGSGPIKKKTQEKDAFRQSAFTSYKEFKQKAEADYNDFRNKAATDFEAFKNGVEPKDTTKTKADEDYAKALSEPWVEHQAHEGENSPLIGKPKTAPVYKGNESTVNNEPARELAERPVDNKETKPSHGTNVVDNKTVDAGNGGQNVSKEPEKEAVPQNKVERQGVSGSYEITTGKNGNGFELNHKMQVRMLGEARKFFSPGFGEIKRGEDGYYSYRGIKSKNYNVIATKVQSASMEVSANNAIYNDLQQKKNSGKELSAPEKNFVAYHMKNLALYNLSVDGQGNLIDKTE